MLKKVFLALGAALLAFSAVVASRPGQFHVERSAEIAAPPAVAFSLVNDFHRWQSWSPWDKLDPNQTRTFSGPAAGTGSEYHWVGNDKVGEGHMTITESLPAQRVALKLDFLKPMKATNTTVFAFTPTAKGTQVVWSMDGTNNFFGKAFMMFNDMDKMVGGDFERGLANLGQQAQAEAKRQADAASAAAAPTAAPGAPAPAPTAAQ